MNGRTFWNIHQLNRFGPSVLWRLSVFEPSLYVLTHVIVSFRLCWIRRLFLTFFHLVNLLVKCKAQKIIFLIFRPTLNYSLGKALWTIYVTNGMMMDRTTTSVPKSVLCYVVDKVGIPRSGNQSFPIFFFQMNLVVEKELIFLNYRFNLI